MSFQTIPTQYASVNGTKIAYRRLGKPANDNIPLLFLTHFRGTMDIIDPLLANTIAKSRELILFDSIGVGHSEGAIPSTLQSAGAITVAFLAAIGVPKVDLLGFSMGGLTAQVIAVEHPAVVRKLVLAGTQSSYSPGAVGAPREIFELASGPSPDEEVMLKLFFYPSETSRALGSAWWRRIQERDLSDEKRTMFVSQEGAQVQQEAITNFVSDATFWDKVKGLDVRVLITNGKDDVMTPTPNSWLMQQNFRNAQLYLYPDSGHGHLYQEPEAYARLLELFLG
ncbi:alpha/beta-hydrolase [Aaosphaeria arxii CBS 175.79]|uniref:Alpha/beta-hydrolase n=1 Tax=Aaosphaeria arxii CBS 175.79 TaxID=1450172 RepID=A0A6A5X7S2_9PLEO|nr:alpha/beta-hydrolase [Aaosphaeria arxii CBS 175.79]KAF2008804.1 alpha/beta-hydrolase [Aaosphaeria arxii CBS 175.79]